MDDSIGYIAMVPAGAYGAPRWALVRPDRIAPSPFSENSTREDVRRALEKTGLRLREDNRVEWAAGRGPEGVA